MREGRFAAILAGAGFAAPAHAHLVENGFGGFYDGVAHVALTPWDLLLIIGLALYVGQRGTQAARPALFALPLAWFAGGLFAAALPIDASLALVTTLGFGVAGALAALNARLPTGAVLVLVLGTGLLHGYVNGASTDA